MTLPHVPVAVVFSASDYDVKADMLRLYDGIPVVPDCGRFFVFSTPELANEFIRAKGASALRVVRCPAGRLRDILHFAQPHEIIIDPGIASQLTFDPRTTCQTLTREQAFSWAYVEIAKSDPLVFPCFSPTDAIHDDFVPLLNIVNNDHSRDFWPIFSGENVAARYGKLNGGGRQREIYTFANAKDLLEKVNFDRVAEKTDEVWIGSLTQDGNRKMQFIWAEKMPLSVFRQRAVARAHHDHKSNPA